jgi:cell division septum initiation protein DivIVA
MAEPSEQKAKPQEDPTPARPPAKPSTPAAGADSGVTRRLPTKRFGGQSPAARPKRPGRPGRPQPPGRQARTALDRVRDVDFPLAFRGYERSAVDRHLQAVSQLVAELEARQLRESVVQRALDEVGEQTEAIMRRANEAADEVSARSKSQAEGRIQRAEREADAIRREAQDEADRVRSDTLRLWAERQQLIEEIRHLADETLSVADVAMERLAEPPRMGSREAAAGPATEELDEEIGAVAEESPAETPVEEEPPAPQPESDTPS